MNIKKTQQPDVSAAVNMRINTGKGSKYEKKIDNQFAVGSRINGLFQYGTCC